MFRNQRNFLYKLQHSCKQQTTSNEHLNRITIELRRATQILSLMADINDEQLNEPHDNSSTQPIQQEAKLYVGNIDYSITTEELEDVFIRYGDICGVSLPIDRYSGKTRGFGFVTFTTTENALKALELNGSELKGRNIQVNFAREHGSKLKEASA